MSNENIADYNVCKVLTGKQAIELYLFVSSENPEFDSSMT